MLARKCDRCDTFYAPEAMEIDGDDVNAVYTINRTEKDEYEGGTVYDLCPACLASWQKWLGKTQETK